MTTTKSAPAAEPVRFGRAQRPELAHPPAAEHPVHAELAGEPVHVGRQPGLVELAGLVERGGGGRPQPAEALPRRRLRLGSAVVHYRVSASQSATAGLALNQTLLRM